MKNPLVYAKNLIRVCVWKIRHMTSLNIGAIQSFEKIRLQISNGGKVQMGSFNQNRDKLYIGVFGGNLKIGSHCFFNINSSITCVNKIEIGDNCKFGNNLVIVDHDHNYRVNGEYTKDNPEFVSSPIKIGNNVWCGANVTILRGTEIGDNCVIAAGSTVKGIYGERQMIIPQTKNTLKNIREGGYSD